MKSDKRNKPVDPTTPIRRARYVLTGGRWFLIVGLVFYSAMTTTPFVARHSEWAWSGWVLGLIVDAAFIMALSAESTLARHNITGLGRWPLAFRWTTGLASTFLNVWLSVAARDWVGVAVHLIAPALVMLLAEVGPVYMAALANAEAKALSTAEKAPEPTADKHQGEPETARMVVVHPPETVTRSTVAGMANPEPAKPTFTPLPDEPGQLSLDVAKPRLSNAEANAIIERAWRHKVDALEAAAAAGRHVATVRKKYAQLEAELSV
ncbi:hypothetical protein ACFQ7F_13110 [Streptomyces sp. NPDC056486]|uniref:hypothetical protein n=1 Tax=Streptomyces sp. NPDC056486 TaxID=3345835 RepID=UPI0036D11DE3